MDETEPTRTDPGRSRSGAFLALGERPLSTRQDMAAAVLAFCRPLFARMSDGRARVRIDTSGASFSRTVQEMEGLCRLLWGIAPYVRGVPQRGSDESELLCEGLANGSDPAHPEFWGAPRDLDQRFVEFGAIAYAILIAPDAFWAPLGRRHRSNLTSLLQTINQREIRDNNWLFFRVLVNEALRTVDAPYSPQHVRRDLDRIESFRAGDGWYRDGPDGPCDYYTAFGFHYYALLYVTLGQPDDRARAERLREYASCFAAQFVHWFSTDGSAIPYGRSLSYRFAHGAFWAALAFAGLEPLPTPVIKGVLLRNLRWWLGRAPTDDSGLLKVGYGYENGLVAERYTSAASPYWALKVFLPLALEPGHRFWQSTEQSLPQVEEVLVQRAPQAILVRHGAHAYALSGGRAVPQQHRHAAEKYAKFCYSNLFAFSLPAAPRFKDSGAHDSMLAVTSDGVYFRVRTSSRWSECRGNGIVARWEPWPDVEVTTWLIPTAPWHLRVHCLRTARPVTAIEGGFCNAWDEEEETSSAPSGAVAGLAYAASSSHVSVILDLLARRAGTLIETDPNTNVLQTRSRLPTLESHHAAGEHWLACGVAGSRTDDAILEQLLRGGPRLTIEEKGFVAFDAAGKLLYADTVSRVDDALSAADRWLVDSSTRART